MLKRIFRASMIGLLAAVFLLLLLPSLRIDGSLFSHNIRLPLTESPVSYSDGVKQAAPAVVNIYNRAIENSATNIDKNLTIKNLGSGVIMNSKGYIITNLHVIDDAEQIIVALQTGQIFEGILVGSDRLTDLAVLKIEAQNLPVIPINLDRPTHVGDIVLAIGNPYNIGQTVTQGIISATGRIGLSPYRRQNFLQTDASINHGNSGGALINTLGELVGINTLSYGKGMEGDTPEGLGFAIPTALATKIMDKLIRDGRVIRGYIGIDGLEFSPVHSSDNSVERIKGILVKNVDSPAIKAGIQPKDILISVNNESIDSIVETMDQIAEIRPGTTIPIIVLRNGERVELQLTIGELN